MTGHLVYPILTPLAGAILCLALHRAPRLQRWVSLAALASVVAYTFGWFWPALGAGGVLTLRLGNWPAPYGIVLAADLTSGIMLALSALVGLAVLVYASAWLAGQKEETFFYPLYLVLFMGIHGAFLTGDIFNLYVFFEVLLVASFGLLALGGGRSQMEGAIKYVVMSQVSSALFLVGAGLLYGVAGTLNLADLAQKLAMPQTAPYAAVAAPLFLLAFGIKAAVFPLFFWLPASYHTASTPIAAVFAGLLTKVGVYALFRAYTLLFPGPWAAQRELLLAVAALTMLVGVLGALIQRDLKRLLAFEVISQVGYLVLALGLGSRDALAAALYFLVHVILAKTAVFLVAGLIERAAETTELAAMGGLLRKRPALAGLFLVAALSLAGVPPSSGFVAKYGLVLAALRARQFLPTAAALAASILTLYVMIRVWNEVFMKDAPESVGPPAGLMTTTQAAHSNPREVSGAPATHSNTREITRAQPVLAAAALSLVALAVAAAVFAGPLYALSQQAAGQLLDPAPYLSAVLGSPGP